MRSADSSTSRTFPISSGSGWAPRTGLVGAGELLRQQCAPFHVHQMPRSRWPCVRPAPAVRIRSCAGRRRWPRCIGLPSRLLMVMPSGGARERQSRTGAPSRRVASKGGPCPRWQALLVQRRGARPKRQAREAGLRTQSVRSLPHALDGLPALLSQRPGHIRWSAGWSSRSSGSSAGLAGRSSPASFEVRQDQVVGPGSEPIRELPRGVGPRRSRPPEARGGASVSRTRSGASSTLSSRRMRNAGGHLPAPRAVSRRPFSDAGPSGRQIRRREGSSSVTVIRFAHELLGAVAPAAGCDRAGSPSRVRISTAGALGRSFNRRVASRPSTPGIAMSISTTFTCGQSRGTKRDRLVAGDRAPHDLDVALPAEPGVSPATRNSPGLASSTRSTEVRRTLQHAAVRPGVSVSGSSWFRRGKPRVRTPRSDLVGAHDPGPDRIPYETGHVVDTQTLHQLGPMRLDRLGAQAGRRAAISLVPWPSAMSWRTSRCRGVRRRGLRPATWPRHAAHGSAARTLPGDGRDSGSRRPPPRSCRSRRQLDDRGIARAGIRPRAARRERGTYSSFANMERMRTRVRVPSSDQRAPRPRCRSARGGATSRSRTSGLQARPPCAGPLRADNRGPRPRSPPPRWPGAWQRGVRPGRGRGRRRASRVSPSCSRPPRGKRAHAPRCRRPTRATVRISMLASDEP